MEGSETLFCSSKFTWASARISSKLRTAFSRVSTQRVLVIPSTFVENLGTPPQNVRQTWSSHVRKGVAFSEMGCEGCLPSNAVVVAWSCAFTSVYVLVLWWLPGHSIDFAGSGLSPSSRVSHKTWADYQLSRKAECPHFCFPRGSLCIWDLLYSQHAVLPDLPSPPPHQWRIYINFAVSFNNSPLAEWLIYHLVCVCVCVCHHN